MAKIIECNNYSDENGNKIIGIIKNCEVIFDGENSILTVGEGFKTSDMRIRLCNNCRVAIGDNVNTNNSFWNFYDNSECTIGDNCRFKHDGFMSAAPFAKISIGNGFTAEHKYIIIALPHSEIRFGEDCMVSRFVSFQSNDGHDIFDVKTGKNTNASLEMSKRKKIIIGNHVWIGQDATVLYNTEIGDGSIVGTKSLVKSKFPNNCVIAGNPARLIKTDVAWSRTYGEADIKVIDEKYVKLTEE